MRLEYPQPGGKLFALAQFRTKGLVYLTEAGDIADNVSSKVELKQDWKTSLPFFSTLGTDPRVSCLARTLPLSYISASEAFEYE